MAARKRSPETPVLEWISAALGLALLLGLVGVIGWQAVYGGTDQPPAIELAVVRVVPAGSGFVVEIEARNRSGGTAAGLEVEGTIRQGEAVLETSAVTFDYVAGHSVAGGGLVFTRDPRAHRLELRARGFQEP